MKNTFKFITIICFIAISTLTISSCKKEGTGGKSKVSGYVKHHNGLIPNSIVYIKYGAKEFPGADASNYDDQITADSNAYYEFDGLQKGDYYLYGVGMDGSQPVKGGVGIKLRRNEDLESDVPVTE